MKQKLTLLLSFMALVGISNAQSFKNIKNIRSLVGIHVNSMDVTTPQAWKDNEGSKTLSGLQNQDLGISFAYYQLISPRVDFSGKATVMFHDYSGADRNVYSNKFTPIGLEFEPSVNIKAFEDNYAYNAFVSAGIGAGIYGAEFGAYVPVGLGLQANFAKTTYMFLQSQYRFTLTKSALKDNLFYSVGIAQRLSK